MRAQPHAPRPRFIRRFVVAGSVALGSIAVGVPFVWPGSTFLGVASSATHQSAAPGAPATYPVGMNMGGRLAYELEQQSPAQQQATLQDMKAAGYNMLRLDVPFAADEPQPGTFQWPQTQLVEQAQLDGIGVDALLDDVPKSASMLDGSPQPAAYAAFSRAAVQHFAPLGVTLFELENEPNRPANRTMVNPTDYANLLKATYPAIKGADPAATVLLGGLADAADSPINAEMSPSSFLQAVYKAGAGRYFDGIAVHPSTAPYPPDYPTSWNAFYTLPRLHQISVNSGFPRTPVWITEFGAPTSGSQNSVSPPRQARDLTAAYQQARAWPWVAGFFFFEWQDEPLDGGNWGLTTASGAEKPAFGAVAQALGGSARSPSVPPLGGGSPPLGGGLPLGGG